jgi:orotidine-5'-phosphate decarboxylase
MSEIIVALDGYAFQEALDRNIFGILSRVSERGLIWGVKFNDLLYTGDVPLIMKHIKEDYGLRIMADVKLHDIPNTIENCITRLIDIGSDIVTVHCSSNYRPKRPEILKHIAGVTALTSFTDLEVKWIYDRSTEEIVKAFADIALMNHYEYIQCSVRDLQFIQNNPLKKICTGVRPNWYQERHDQVRVASIKEAVRMEADLIIIGRPILQSGDIIAAVERVHSELQ